MHYAVIMAGGSGTRLWPMSRAEQPKQLIPFLQGRSLLEIAADRLDGLIDAERRLICTGEKFRGAIRESLPIFGDEQILGEPEGRDTLAAVGLPAAVLGAADPDAVIAVFTADHVIEPIDVFARCVRTGLELAEKRPDTLVTFGIEPTHAATGYGYVELAEPLEGFEGAHRTAAFREKPDAATAQRYLDSGRYLWNSGMFVWRADTLLDCIGRYEPEVRAGLAEIAEAWPTEHRAEVLGRVYPTLKKTSVDFGVMEPASKDPKVNIATVRMPVRWLDVGGWPAYGETLEPDADGNRVAAARAATIDSQDNLIVCDDDDHLIATLGVRDLVIVRCGHATLVCHRDAAQQIKAMQAHVKETFGDDYV